MRPAGHLDNHTYKNEWMKNSISSKKNKNSLNDCKGVMYSLNKRKMWTVPEKMKNEVLSESHRNDIEPYVENDVRVAVIDYVYSNRYKMFTESKSFINSVDEKENRSSKSW